MSAPVFATFGCRLNAYETEAMKGLAAEAAGVGDVVVVNSCAVTGEAVRQARQQNPPPAPRQPGRAGDRDRLRGADRACDLRGDARGGPGARQRREAAAGRLGAAGGAPARAAWPCGDIMAERRTPAPLIDGLGTRARAYVQVQTGCDHRCTFCIIPYGRGNSRSVPAATVVAQIARLVDRGFNEVVLTGVDLTSWGADLDGAPRLGDLVAAILARVPDLPRLRLSSIDSVEADPRLIEAIAAEPRLMPHLHLSLQAGDDLILKRMKRRHLRDDAIAFCETVRAARPDMVFGADIIAGFPTETEAMFESSLELVEECGLTWLHVFPFSARSGTPAARMPQVDGAAIRERARACAPWVRTGWRRISRRCRARPVRLLMERPNLGRTEGFAQTLVGGRACPGRHRARPGHRRAGRAAAGRSGLRRLHLALRLVRLLLDSAARGLTSWPAPLIVLQPASARSARPAAIRIFGIGVRPSFWACRIGRLRRDKRAKPVCVARAGGLRGGGFRLYLRWPICREELRCHPSCSLRSSGGRSSSAPGRHGGLCLAPARVRAEGPRARAGARRAAGGARGQEPSRRGGARRSRGGRGFRRVLRLGPRGAGLEIEASGLGRLRMRRAV